MATILSAWIRKFGFEIATFIALAAVLVSGTSTYRAINDLPEIQRTIVSLEEGLEQLSQLRRVLGLADWQSRAMTLSGPDSDKDDTLRRQLTATASRGQQLCDELAERQLSGDASLIVSQSAELLARY